MSTERQDNPNRYPELHEGVDDILIPNEKYPDYPGVSYEQATYVLCNIATALAEGAITMSQAVVLLEKVNDSLSHKYDSDELYRQIGAEVRGYAMDFASKIALRNGNL